MSTRDGITATPVGAAVAGLWGTAYAELPPRWSDFLGGRPDQQTHYVAENASQHKLP